MKTIKISIPSLIDNIKVVESFIDNAREKFEINDDVYGNIMISVTECVSNAILHGNKADKEKSVHLELQMDEGLLQFIVSDEGEGFDEDSIQDPTSPENLEKPGGRGIFLIKHLTDEFKLEGNGSKATLGFYLN